MAVGSDAPAAKAVLGFRLDRGRPREFQSRKLSYFNG